MYEYNYEAKPKNWLQKLISNPTIQAVIIVITVVTFLFVDSTGIFKSLNMNLEQILLLVAIGFMFYLWRFFNQKMVKEEISKAVDQRLKNIESQLDAIPINRDIAHNNRVIQNEINEMIAESLNDLGKGELKELIQKNNKNLIKHIAKDSRVNIDDAKHLVSNFNVGSSFNIYTKRYQ